jgi:hypothetical protein
MDITKAVKEKRITAYLNLVTNYSSQYILVRVSKKMLM